MAGTFGFNIGTDSGSFQLGYAGAGAAPARPVAGEPGSIAGIPTSKLLLVGALAVGATVLVLLLK